MGRWQEVAGDIYSEEYELKCEVRIDAGWVAEDEECPSLGNYSQSYITNHYDAEAYGSLGQYLFDDLFGSITQWTREECEEADCLHPSYSYGSCLMCIMMHKRETLDGERDELPHSEFTKAFCRACNHTREDIAEWYSRKKAKNNP